MTIAAAFGYDISGGLDEGLNLLGDRNDSGDVDLDLVVAFTGHNYENGPGVTNLYEMMSSYIIDSIN